MIVPQAVAQNFETLLVTRAIAGFFGGIIQNAMEIFIADMWLTDDKRNLPMTLFTFLCIQASLWAQFWTQKSKFCPGDGESFVIEIRRKCI